MRKQTKLVAVLSAAALLAIGASMTSFAATRGWVQEGEDWVYLDNDGERVFNQWKRSGDFYYYLGEDGVMVTDQLIHDDTLDAYYYVNENGVRIMNDWKSIPNDEGVQVGENTPEVLYYHFGSAGKADRSTGDALKVKTIDGKHYAFDTDGRMASGWQWVEVNGESELYYFGTELEGWAYTGWQQLEPGENLREDDYDDLEWYWFESNGRAARDKSKNINGKYYAFDANGVMLDDWYTVSTEPMAASNGIAFASSNGTLANGWVYTNPQGEDDADDVWFYLVTIRDGSKIKRSVPYNYFPSDYERWGQDSWFGDEGYDDPEFLGEKGVRAKVIKNKTYIFDTDGQMLTGFVAINNDGDLSADLINMVDTKEGHDTVQHYGKNLDDKFTADIYGALDTTNGIKGRALVDGLYYFNEAGGSVNGQLMTGRTAVTKDGETFYYYFNKTGNQNTAADYGVALHSTVKDGYLYGRDGRCLVNDDGNSYSVYKVSDIAETHFVNSDDRTGATETGIKLSGKSGDTSIIDESVTEEATKNGVDTAYVVVSRSGRIKQSGTATIDGIRYTIKDYKVINTKAVD